MYSIKNNLSGKYYLTQDIDMFGYDWTPIGKRIIECEAQSSTVWKDIDVLDDKFSGMLDGNGFVIYNLSSNIDLIYKRSINGVPNAILYGCALFSYNYGTITNVKLYNTLYQCEFSEDIPTSMFSGSNKSIALYFGGVCVSNYGVISNCEVQGSISLNDSILSESSRLWGNHFIGGICSVSYGQITSCSGTVKIESIFPSCMDEICPCVNNAIIGVRGHSFISKDFDSFKSGCIWYTSNHENYRCQPARHHSIVNVCDGFEEKEGYSFVGWSLTEGGPVQYLPGDEIYIPYEKDNLVLYSVWKRVCEVGDVITFGTYEQDNDTTNGKEDIEWIVLEKEGDKALIISKYALDCKPYNTSNIGVTWGTCSLRRWLNETFFNAAFSSKEQNRIITSTVTADSNPSYSTSPGNNTSDKVFLLSITEVNKYFSSNDARSCGATAYAKAQGANTNTSNGNCWWWLRSPGRNSRSAASVSNDGSVDNYGYFSHDDGAVRPALWINLGS